MTEQPNCYKCKYRGTVLGSTHSCCEHPSVKEVLKDPLAQLSQIFGSVGRTPPVVLEVNPLGIIGNEQGIRGGWFQWPWNFDPIWLESCNGFEKKEVKKKNG